MFINRRFSTFFSKCAHKRDIDFLVLHHIEADSLDHAIEQLDEHEVSAHFVIDEGGQIHQLVAENNIAYHAGVSFWHGVDGLNKSSIGIEFLTKDAFKVGYTDKQMRTGIQLCRYLINKYNIIAHNVVGHSDIGYCKDSGLLDRKQDPSQLFDWKYLSDNGIGIYVDVKTQNDEVMFKLGDNDAQIGEIKQLLSQCGYKVSNVNNEFNVEMQHVVRVFHRRFNQRTFKTDPDCWYKSSQHIIKSLIHEIKKN